LASSPSEKKKRPGGPEVPRRPFRAGCSPIPHKATSTRLETSWRTRVWSSSQLMSDKRDQILRPVKATLRVYPQVPRILQPARNKVDKKENLGHLRGQPKNWHTRRSPLARVEEIESGFVNQCVWHGVRGVGHRRVLRSSRPPDRGRGCQSRQSGNDGRWPQSIIEARMSDWWKRDIGRGGSAPPLTRR